MFSSLEGRISLFCRTLVQHADSLDASLSRHYREALALCQSRGVLPVLPSLSLLSVNCLQCLHALFIMWILRWRRISIASSDSVPWLLRTTNLPLTVWQNILAHIGLISPRAFGKVPHFVALYSPMW